jgi:hypothetical protein
VKKVKELLQLQCGKILKEDNMKNKKENPLTFFRKANEARQAKVKKSLPKAQDGKNVVYQGPISEEGNRLISRAEDNKQRYPLSVPKEINDIAQSDRNPKNSKRIEKGKPYVKLSKDMGNAYRKDFKNLPKDSPEKKERRTNAIIATVTEAVAAPFIGKFVAKNWNLPKKKGGVVKSKKK